MGIQYEPIKQSVGAIVHADKAALQDPAFASQVMEMVMKHGVVVFPKIGLTDAEQLAFTDKLGARVHFATSAPGADASAEGVYTVTLDPKINNQPEYVLGTFFYHMDGMATDGIPPPRATVLSCRRKAAQGGQTEFASTVAAYEALPEDEKQALEKLRVVHSVVAGVREVQDALHLDERRRGIKAERPLVWKKPDGSKSLLIGYTAEEVVGMSQAEGRALLIRLIEWAAQPAFAYKHEWSEGDLVIWDNCGALHRVIPYTSDSGRRMHRTSVAGYEIPQ
ncbi:MAG: TauD/TfdA family dioxygenase [Solimonas sp.]